MNCGDVLVWFVILCFPLASACFNCEHYCNEIEIWGLILLSIIITHHDASSVFFFDTQKSPILMMFYFWWKNFRFPWRGSKLQTTGEHTLIKAWSSKDWTKDPFLNFVGFFFQFVVSLSGSIMPWNRGQMNFKTRPWPWSLWSPELL